VAHEHDGRRQHRQTLYNVAHEVVDGGVGRLTRAHIEQ
jgi:hypothetical protein